MPDNDVPSSKDIAEFVEHVEKLSKYEVAMRLSRGWGAFSADYLVPKGAVRTFEWLKAGYLIKQE